MANNSLQQASPIMYFIMNIMTHENPIISTIGFLYNIAKLKPSRTCQKCLRYSVENVVTQSNPSTTDLIIRKFPLGFHEQRVRHGVLTPFGGIHQAGSHVASFHDAHTQLDHIANQICGDADVDLSHVKFVSNLCVLWHTCSKTKLVETTSSRYAVPAGTAGNENEPSVRTNALYFPPLR